MVEKLLLACFLSFCASIVIRRHYKVRPNFFLDDLMILLVTYLVLWVVPVSTIGFYARHSEKIWLILILPAIAVAIWAGSMVGRAAAAAKLAELNTMVIMKYLEIKEELTSEKVEQASPASASLRLDAPWGGVDAGPGSEGLH